MNGIPTTGTARDAESEGVPEANPIGVSDQSVKIGAQTATKPALSVIHVELAEANAFVAKHHRHHKPVVGHRFSIGLTREGELCGVAILGRPVSRMMDDGLTLEVNRVATDGTKNACSALYGAARRACFALGYKRLVTYTLPTEGGASLRGAGWKCLGTAGGGRWSRNGRERYDAHPLQEKLKWEANV